MIKAIFYKEWIKMRCFYPLSALFLFGATAYALLRVQRVITFKGAAHVWEVMLEKEVVFIDILQYLPALLGVLLAVVQFVPEMAQKRLKLTLHLPFPQWKMILLMSGIGLERWHCCSSCKPPCCGGTSTPCWRPNWSRGFC